MELRVLEAEVKAWSSYNFPNAQPWEPLLGLQEEVGELSHHWLKRHQGIRLEEDHDYGIHDAVGDIFIYLCDFCWRNGLFLNDAVEKAWGEVKQRDWVERRKTYKRRSRR